MVYLAFWLLFGLGYGLALAANAPRQTFVLWKEQLAVVLVCMILSPIVPIFQFIYRIYHL